MYVNVDVDGDELSNERMHYWVICSCIHKCPEAMIMILFCIHMRWLEYFVFKRRCLWYNCIQRRWPAPHAYRVVSRAHCLQLISVILAYVLGVYVYWWNLVIYILVCLLYLYACILVCLLYLHTIYKCHSCLCACM